MSDTPLGAQSFRPRLRFGGRDHAVVTENLLSLSFEEATGTMASLEVVLLNLKSNDDGTAEAAFDSDEIIGLGTEVSLGLGLEDQPWAMFSGVVTGIEELHGIDGPPRLVVLAEDALQKARLKRRTKVHDSLSIQALAEDLASDLGLQPRVEGFSDDIGTQVQLDESDLAFLQRLLLERDGELQVIEGELHVSPRPDVRRGTVELESGRNLLRCRVAADLAHQVTQVTVSGWDHAQGQRIGVTSAPSDFGPGRGLPAAGVLDRALGARSEHIGHVPVSDETEAQALADAAHRQRARSFVRLEGTAAGNPLIRVGAQIRLSGVGTRFSNTYQVSRTLHRFDRTAGYETDFEAGCAFLGDGS